MHRLRQSRLVVQIAAPVLASGLALLGSRPDAGRADDPPAPFTLVSPAFAPGGAIPARYTADGLNHSPPLAWRRLPPGTRQLALVMEAADHEPHQPWVHWVIYNIDVETLGLPAGLARDATLETPIRAAQGTNSWPKDSFGYRGPAPPEGEPPHRYRFRLYALKEKLDLPPGLDRDRFQRRIDSHVLNTADLIGTYRR